MIDRSWQYRWIQKLHELVQETIALEDGVDNLRHFAKNYFERQVRIPDA